MYKYRRQGVGVLRLRQREFIYNTTYLNVGVRKKIIKEVKIMGYDYGDAWIELFELFKDLPPNTESEMPFNNNSRKWIRDKMLDIERNLTVEKR